MRKLTMLGLSLILSVGAFAQAQLQPAKAQKQGAASTKTEQTASLKLKVRSHERTRKANTIPGIVEKKSGVSNALINKAKARTKAPVTSSKIYAGMLYPQALLGGGKIDPATGEYTALYSNTAPVHVIGVNPDLGEVYSVEYLQTSTGISLTGLRYAAYDLTSGNLKRELAVTTQEVFDNLPMRGAYNPEDNCLYGYGNAGWVKVDCNTFESTVLNDNDVFPFALTYNCDKGEFVALVSSTTGFGIASVDIETGELGSVTAIPGVTSDYLGGFGYDSTSESYLFNPNDDYTSEIVSIDAKTLAVTTVCELPGAPETGCIYVDEVKPKDPQAPQAPEFVRATFPNGSLTGTVTFALPTQTVGKENLQGQVSFVIKANGQDIATGSAVAGSEASASYTASESGMVEFSCVASQGTHIGKAAMQKVFVGNDVPAAPRNIKLTPTTVSWDAVTTGANGGFIDPSKVTYTVKINGEIVAQDIKATSCATNLPVNVQITNYVAEVTAAWNGVAGPAGTSNDVLFGQPFSEPVSFAPTASEAGLFTVIDNNHDGKAWTYDAANGYFFINYNTILDMDDYLILPPVLVDDFKNLHQFSFDAWARGTSFPEQVEVWIGQEPTAEAMTTKILDKTVLKGSTKQNLSCYFQVPEAGRWYIAVKGVSEKNMYTLYANNFAVNVSNVAAKGPAAVENIEAIPGAEGALKATIKFNMPTKDNLGNALKGDVTVTVEDDVDLKSVTGKPGSAQTVEILTIQGDNAVTIQPSQGEVLGFPTVINVYTGVVVPGPVSNMVLAPSADNYGISLKFDAPESGVNGGYINKSELTYGLYQYVILGEIFGIPIGAWQKLADLGTTTELEGTLLNEGTALASYQLGVAAENAAGAGAINGTTLLLGKPYDLPVIEDISKGTITYGPLMVNAQGGMEYYYLLAEGLEEINPAYATQGAAIIAMGTEGQYGEFSLPTVSTKGADKAAFEISYYVGAAKNVTVYAQTYGVPAEELFNEEYLMGYPEGFQTLPIQLPAKFQDKDWVDITIRCEFSDTKGDFVWSGYKLINMVQKDMAALNITAPKRVETGADYKVAVEVANYGLNEAAGYTVELYANEEKVAEKACGELASFADNTVEFDCAMSPVADEPVAYYAVVKQAGDANTNNDKTATIEVAPKQSKLPGATALTAGNSEGAVALTWDEPDMTNVAPEEITQDFEDGDAFAAEYGDWVFVDVDDSAVGGFQNMDIPGITPGETKGSFWIWDQSQVGNQTFGAHSGTKYLFSLFRYDDGQADDWAISPELAGIEQTISFYAKSYSADYPETIEVWYSEGSTDPKDFMKIEDAGGVGISDEWTLYEAFLPEGAKRFAIRSCASSSFMLMVDDVTFTPAGVAVGDLTLKGYNVYRDGVKINDALVEETVYADSNVTEGTEYTYVVVAVFEEGDGKMSNKATIKYETSGLNGIEGGKLVAAGKGEIVIKGFEGENVLISTADGKVIANGVAAATETVNVPAGIYVVKAGKNSVKVVVR